jgi:hypothetical protein
MVAPDRDFGDLVDDMMKRWIGCDFNVLNEL